MYKQPKISVLIPTYNHAHFLDETIQSVLNQSFKDFELIIVDNYSTDNTGEVVGKYLGDSRVKYYKSERNLSLSGNWNRCLGYSTAEYIKFICADDKIHPEMLDKFYAVMELYPNVSLITCDKQLFGDKPWLVQLPLRHLQAGKDVIFNTMANRSWIGEPTSVMFRKSNLKLGYFRNDYKLHVDSEMWNRHLTVGDCYIFPEALAYVRSHVSQHSRSMADNGCFEEYYMARLMHEYHGFESDDDRARITKIVKDKAAKCAEIALYKGFRLLLQKKKRRLVKEAFKIAFRERVFLKGLSFLLPGRKSRSVDNLAQSHLVMPFSMLAKIIQLEEMMIPEFCLFI